jgi:enamine deaminase RidA (YjgF/YER057c/UK114 family)
MSVNDRLKELGIMLPQVPEPLGNYVDAVHTGNLLFLSGKGPREAIEGGAGKGKLGKDVTVEQGYQDARSVGLILLAVMEKQLGNLDRVKRIVKVLGMVNSAPDFGDQPKVINGCSDLFVEVLGDNGRHARSAVGMGALPGNITVEIEVIVEVE